MRRDTQQQIDAMREGLRKAAEASGVIWSRLSERGSRFDRHQQNASLSPCEEATLLAQAAEDVFAAAVLALANYQTVHDQASQYRDAAVIEMNNQCIV